MHVTICIVGFRNHEEIVACLGTLERLDYQKFDVVICENGGEAAHDQLVQALQQASLSNARILVLCAPGNLGYAGGVNHCIRSSPGSDAWWVLNPDTQPELQALSALVRRLKQGDVNAAGSLLYNHAGLVQACGGRWRGWLARAESIGIGTRLVAPPEPKQVEAAMNYILGASMLIDGTFLSRAGYMRDDYFLYCEEVEWCLRARAAGLRIGYAPNSRVCHGQGGTTGSSAPMKIRPKLPIMLDERNKLLVVRDTTPALLPVAVIASLVLLTVRYLRKGAVRQWRFALEGWVAGVRGERGAPSWLS